MAQLHIVVDVFLSFHSSSILDFISKIGNITETVIDTSGMLVI